MSIQYLFIIDFEGRDIIKISKDQIEIIQEQITESKNICLEVMKNQIIEYKKDLECETKSFKFFARKNGDMIITGIITKSSYKDHNAINFIENIFEIIKKYDLENLKNVKNLEKEVLYFFNQQQKKDETTKIILTPILLQKMSCHL